METLKAIVISIFSIFVFAWIIVNLSGEFSWRRRNMKSVLLVMAVISISLPIIGFIVN